MAEEMVKLKKRSSPTPIITIDDDPYHPNEPRDFTDTR